MTYTRVSENGSTEEVQAFQFKGTAKFPGWFTEKFRSALSDGTMKINVDHIHYQGDVWATLDDWIILRPDNSIAKCNAGEFRDTYKEAA